VAAHCICIEDHLALQKRHLYWENQIKPKDGWVFFNSITSLLEDVGTLAPGESGGNQT
jgi:hypothetical protein